MKKILLLLIATSSCASLVGYVDGGAPMMGFGSPRFQECMRSPQFQEYIILKARSECIDNNDEEHKQLSAGKPTTQQPVPAPSKSYFNFINACIEK